MCMLRGAGERTLTWSGSAQAEFGFKADPQMKDQLKYALDNGIRFLVLFGEEELKAGAVLCCALLLEQVGATTNCRPSGMTSG